MRLFRCLSFFILFFALVAHLQGNDIRCYNSKDIEKLEGCLVGMINKERAKHSLKALKVCPVLKSHARTHSQRMAAGAIPLGHHGFDKRAALVQQQKNIVSFGENVAYCLNHKDPLQVVVDKWMTSPAHRKNILDDYTMTGIAIASDKKGGLYMTQLFSTSL